MHRTGTISEAWTRLPAASRFNLGLLWIFFCSIELQPSALHIGELCGHFAVSYRKNVNAAQVPWLTVAHLAINPEDCRPSSAHDHFFGV